VVQTIYANRASKDASRNIPFSQHFSPLFGTGEIRLSVDAQNDWFGLEYARVSSANQPSFCGIKESVCGIIDF
jgi:hypothetical protein